MNVIKYLLTSVAVMLSAVACASPAADHHAHHARAASSCVQYATNASRTIALIEYDGVCGPQPNLIVGPTMGGTYKNISAAEGLSLTSKVDQVVCQSAGAGRWTVYAGIHAGQQAAAEASSLCDFLARG